MDHKKTPEPQAETITTHFSHLHPLKLVNYNQTLNLAPSCSRCKLMPYCMIYSCTACNYFLHIKCFFEIPKKLKIHFHKKHALTLHPKPAYREARYKCDACGETGRGLCYQCVQCGIDLHTLCATMPLHVTHASHKHKLNRTYGSSSSSYATRKFWCGICKSSGSSHWIYRCELCGFDAHLNCARGISDIRMYAEQDAECSSSAPVPRPEQGSGPGIMSPVTTNIPLGIPAGGSIVVDGQENDLQAIHQMISNNHAMIHAILAGQAGGNGGDMGSQQVMQLMSGLNSGGAGVGYGGGGGGGGVVGLHQVMQMISGFSNDGIVGGQECLQSMMGGGDGADFLGGAVDFLSGLLGGLNF
ncbi:hypothetical protein PHJA_002272400 [Phtheirospermum japonicum]|uniref:DC1 domain-containing protein n=1 Tax=Phtheirospermum japonicum TaxID=374723 RepID=A0A830CYP0_9LAMI|nr:hypothetical protein PHJA_002272400 [Phtheirospermum japonicum]